jgi:hypothetical protein
MIKSNHRPTMIFAKHMDKHYAVKSILYKIKFKEINFILSNFS